MGCMGSKADNIKVEICGSLRKFEQDCLEEHNIFRAFHGSPPLKAHTALRALALDWAQHLADTNVMEHRPNIKYGENIFWGYKIPVNGKTPVRSWYEEYREFDFDNPDYSSSTGHFTQLVWKNTKLMGTGVAVKDGTVWVVVNYDPAGNIKGKFAKNVAPRILAT